MPFKTIAIDHGAEHVQIDVPESAVIAEFQTPNPFPRPPVRSPMPSPAPTAPRRSPSSRSPA